MERADNGLLGTDSMTYDQGPVFPGEKIRRVRADRKRGRGITKPPVGKRKKRPGKRFSAKKR